MYYFIEPMYEHDIDAVRDIERESNNMPWSAATYRRELRTPATSRYVVARASTTPPPPQGQPDHDADLRRGGLLGLLTSLLSSQPAAAPHPLVGYGGLWLAVDEAHITTIAVARSARGQGIGELLLNGLIDYAYAANAAMLTLEVRLSNTVAQNLYLKYGFHPAGTRKRYYTDNSEDALIMWTDNIHTSAYQTRLADLRRRLFARLRGQAHPLPPEPGDESPLAFPL